MAPRPIHEPVGLNCSGLPQVVLAARSVDPPGTVYTTHHIKLLEINLITSGVAQCVLNDKPFIKEAGHAYIYRGGDVFSGRGDPRHGHYVCRCVRFTWPDPSAAAAVQKIPHDTALRPAARRDVQAVFDAMIDVFAGGQPGWQLGAAGYLLALLSMLAREAARYGSSPSGAGAALDRRLSEGITFMERNLAKRLKIADVAQAARLSEDYFSRLFRRRLGISPLQYLIRLRIQEGRRLLAHNPGLTVREASRRAGFEDAKHFARLFRRHFRSAPDVFRRELAAPRVTLSS